MQVSSIAHAGISCRKKQRPIEVSFDIRWTFHFQSSESRWETSRPQKWEKARRQKIYHLANQLKKKCKKKKVPRNSWPILFRSCFPCTNDWKPSRWRSLSTMGCSCRWRSHLSSVRRRILLLQEQTVAPSQRVAFWHPPIEKTFWLQASIVYLTTFTPRRWRRPIRAQSFLEEEIMEVGIEFRPLHGGNGKTLGGLLENSGSQGRGKQSLGKERRDPLLTVLWRERQKMAFLNSISFVTDRSFTVDSGLL